MTEPINVTPENTPESSPAVPESLWDQARQDFDGIDLQMGEDGFPSFEVPGKDSKAVEGEASAESAKPTNTTEPTVPSTDIPPSVEVATPEVNPLDATVTRLQQEAVVWEDRYKNLQSLHDKQDSERRKESADLTKRLSRMEELAGLEPEEAAPSEGTPNRTDLDADQLKQALDAVHGAGAADIQSDMIQRARIQQELEKEWSDCATAHPDFESHRPKVAEWLAWSAGTNGDMSFEQAYQFASAGMQLPGAGSSIPPAEGNTTTAPQAVNSTTPVSGPTEAEALAARARSLEQPTAVSNDDPSAVRSSAGESSILGAMKEALAESQGDPFV